jgi:hypothetical protein
MMTDVGARVDVAEEEVTEKNCPLKVAVAEEVEVVLVNHYCHHCH